MINKGFTLVELLVVVVILAILAGIVVPQFASSTDDAESAAVDYTLSSVRIAIDLYYQQHGSYPGAFTAEGASCPNSGTAGTGDASDAAKSEDAFLSQLTYYTNAAGQACSTTDAIFKYGPYLKKRPLTAEPFTDSPIIEVVAISDLTMGANTTPAAGPGGYRYDSTNGKFIVNVVAEETR